MDSLLKIGNYKRRILVWEQLCFFLDQVDIFFEKERAKVFSRSRCFRNSEDFSESFRLISADSLMSRYQYFRIPIKLTLHAKVSGSRQGRKPLSCKLIENVIEWKSLWIHSTTLLKAHTITYERLFERPNRQSEMNEQSLHVRSSFRLQRKQWLAKSRCIYRNTTNTAGAIKHSTWAFQSNLLRLLRDAAERCHAEEYFFHAFAHLSAVLLSMNGSRVRRLWSTPIARNRIAKF